MSALLSFRKRIWSLLSSPGFASNHQEISTISSQSSRGTKRKLSFSPEIEVDSAFKRLRLENPDYIKQESIEEDYPMIEPSVGTETQLVIKSESSKHLRIKDKSSSKVSSSPSRIHTARADGNVDSDEEFHDYEVHVDREGLFDDYKIETVAHVTAEDEDFHDWSQQELDFFNSLNDRGVVPMLWSYWKVDFPTLPEDMFTQCKEDAMIRNLQGNALSGARALNALIEAGSLARERQRRGQNAAQLLARSIKDYIKWSFRDARLNQDHYLPLIVVNYAYKNEDLETTDARTQRRVRKLSEKYRQLWDESQSQAHPPTIFHILIARTVMGFGSFDTSTKQPEFRNIFFTDWKQRGHDFWNAMAVALLVHQTRSWLIEVNPRKRHVKKSPEPDPDL